MVPGTVKAFSEFSVLLKQCSRRDTTPTSTLMPDRQLRTSCSTTCSTWTTVNSSPPFDTCNMINTNDLLTKQINTYIIHKCVILIWHVIGDIYMISKMALPKLLQFRFALVHCYMLLDKFQELQKSNQWTLHRGHQSVFELTNQTTRLMLCTN